MKYLFLNKVNDTTSIVGSIVYDVALLSETQMQQALQKEAIPEPEQLYGKSPILMYDHPTDTLYYDYVDCIPTEQTRIQTMEKQVSELTIMLGDELLNGSV